VTIKNVVNCKKVGMFYKLVTIKSNDPKEFRVKAGISLK
jgi:hypothetical protein